MARMLRITALVATAVAVGCASAPVVPGLGDDADARALTAKAEQFERRGLYPEARLAYRAAGSLGADVDGALSELALKVRTQSDETFEHAERLRAHGDAAGARAAYLRVLAVDPTRRDALEALQKLERPRALAHFASRPAVAPPPSEKTEDEEPSIDAFRKSLGGYFDRVRSILEQNGDAPDDADEPATSDKAAS
ncbi:MAG: hypothetical protein AAFV51_08355 [Pseudomonadota bacterium]